MDCFESRLDLNDRRFRVQTGSTTTSAAGNKFSASILLCDCEFGEDGIFSRTRAYIRRQSSAFTAPAARTGQHVQKLLAHLTDPDTRYTGWAPVAFWKGKKIAEHAATRIF